MKRKNRNTPGRKIAQAIIAEYKPKSVAEMQSALKEVFGSMFETMLNSEMESYLGYEPNSRKEKETTNRRNSYFDKTIKTSMGETEIEVPRDRQASFDSIILPKHKRDVSDIENKVLAMYARGMSQRNISATIDDIYDFKLSAEQIPKITDYVLEEQQNWQNRTLAPLYPFLFVDCLFVPIKRDYETIRVRRLQHIGDSGRRAQGNFGALDSRESKHAWMQIFDELKAHGVQEVGFISMDGVSGLEEGARAIFPEVVVQRCIFHLIRNSLKYVPTRDYKLFTSHLKKIYGAPSLKACRVEFERFCQVWSKYPGVIAVWKRCFAYVEQLFEFPSAVRKIMYTTNAIEAVNSSFRKVTKRGAFPNDNSLFKLLYLRIVELQK